MAGRRKSERKLKLVDTATTAETTDEQTAGAGAGKIAGLTIASSDYVVDDNRPISEGIIVVRKRGFTSTKTPPKPPRDDMDARHLSRVASWADHYGQHAYAALARKLLSQRVELRGVFGAGDTAPRRPRARDHAARRARSPGRESDDSEPAAPLAAKPRQLTLAEIAAAAGVPLPDVRKFIAGDRAAAAHARVERERRVRLPGLDPRVYFPECGCVREGNTIWVLDKSGTKPRRKPMCAFHKGERDKARWLTSRDQSPDYWMPTLPLRVAAAAGLVLAAERDGR